MEFALYLGLAAVSLVLLSVACSDSLLGAAGKKLILQNVSQKQSKLGLTEHRIKLSNGATTWYLERPSHGPADGPPIVVLPGGTLNMSFMGIQLERMLKALSHRRVIVVELPHHGRNVSRNLNFSKQANSISSMADHLEALRTALELNEPFDLMGYSLGGGISTEYALTNPQHVHRMILLAPFFYETATERS